MALLVSLELSSSDLEHFYKIMLAVREKTGKMPAQQIIARAGDLLACARRPGTSDFVRDHMNKLAQLINMVEDRDWGLADDDRERVLVALSYFCEPQDLIPDNVPGLGYLDDVIMIEIICKELEHEIEAYHEFTQYRAAEVARRNGHDQTTQKSGWLEERRQQLHSRMRRRRKGERNKAKSPFSLL